MQNILLSYTTQITEISIHLKSVLSWSQVVDELLYVFWIHNFNLKVEFSLKTSDSAYRLIFHWSKWNISLFYKIAGII